MKLREITYLNTFPPSRIGSILPTTWWICVFWYAKTFCSQMFPNKLWHVYVGQMNPALGCLRSMVILFRNVSTSLSWPGKGGCDEIENFFKNLKVLVKVSSWKVFPTEFLSTVEVQDFPQEQTFPVVKYLSNFLCKSSLLRCFLCLIQMNCFKLSLLWLRWIFYLPTRCLLLVNSLVLFCAVSSAILAFSNRLGLNSIWTEHQRNVLPFPK